MTRRSSGLASREGTLRLAMRNYNDDKIVATTGSDFTDLLGARSAGVPLNHAAFVGHCSAQNLPPPRDVIPLRSRFCATARAPRRSPSSPPAPTEFPIRVITTRRWPRPASSASNVPAASDASSTAVTGAAAKPHPDRQRAIGIFSPGPENFGGAVSEFSSLTVNAKLNETSKLIADCHYCRISPRGGPHCHGPAVAAR